MVCTRASRPRPPRWLLACGCAALLLLGACDDDHDGAGPPVTGPAAHFIDPDGSADFVTIGAAIAAAENGDTLHIAAGTYLEALALAGRDLILIGAGPDSTIVQYESYGAPEVPVLALTDGSALVLSGVRLIQEHISCGAGLRLTASSLVVEGCALVRCGLRAEESQIVMAKCTVVGLPIMDCDMIVPLLDLRGGSAILGTSIFAGGHGIACQQTTPLFSCCDFWQLPNLSGCPDPVGADGNIDADPLFVDIDRENLHLRSGSPCLPGQTPGCGRMGALGSE